MRIRVSLSMFLGISLLASFANGQEPTSSKSAGRRAIIVDSFAKSSGEDRSARFDNFFVQILNNEGSIGYVLIFCGKECSYGEIEGHFRGIELKIATRNFPRDRLVVLHGGYRDSQQVELWLVPLDAGAPIPESTRSIKDVTFKKEPKSPIVPYDCCEDDGMLWKKLRPKPNGQKSGTSRI